MYLVNNRTLAWGRKDTIGSAASFGRGSGQVTIVMNDVAWSLLEEISRR